MPLYSVSGIVRDNNSVAIANVVVVLTNVSNNEQLTQQTNDSGEFLFELANLASGFLNGNQIDLYCAYGLYYDEETITIDTSVGSSEQDLTLSTSITAAPVYASIAEVRRYAGADTAEWSDSAVYDFIKAATRYIEEQTGRTWGGVLTSTSETFDGDGTDILWIGRTDIQGVSQIQIDDDLDGTYTSVSSTNSGTSAGAWVYKEEGYLQLERNATINKFTPGPKTIKVTYTYGNKRPSELVRQLAMMIVANFMNFNRDRKAMIDEMIETLKYKLAGLS